MLRLLNIVLLILIIPMAALGQEAKPASASADLLSDALSATYPAHAEGVTAVDWEGNVLQEGSNGYTCMPTPPAFAERGVTSPMCLDEVWLAWADAWTNKKPFSADRVGIAYMLAGDGGASNIDPFAAGPTDDNEWIQEGAHLMIIAPDPELLSGIPTDPSSGGPYVMWRGTDYEHVMVPVKVPDLPEAPGLLGDALSAADVNMRESVTVMDWKENVLQEGGSGY
ncbi:MAG: hypothetical protein R3178_03425, partial [Rhodothermales bacterium]|nr:hypothetical protein [Rhodothermales bacterium]